MFAPNAPAGIPEAIHGRDAVHLRRAALSTGAFTLTIDAVASLARQWILRSESWKLAVAIISACLQVTAGGLIWVALGLGSRHIKAHPFPMPMHWTRWCDSS
jgi:hypothetical protein